MRLEEIQRAVAGCLLGREGAPSGVDPTALGWVRRGLTRKRSRAAERLLPQCRAVLGPAWWKAFEEHARRYSPAGMLYHIDDAWALAETFRRNGDACLRRAARVDLLALRLRFVRRPKEGAHRIRPRELPLLALLPSRPWGLVLSTGVRSFSLSFHPRPRWSWRYE